MGTPASYEPGAEYLIRAVLQRAGLEKGGFQLSARTGDARQAGVLEPVDE